MASDDYYFDADDDVPDSSPAWEASERVDNPIFEATLSRLFAESLEAGLPPKHLRPVLEQGFWLPTAHPGIPAQGKALGEGREFGGKKQQKKPAPPQARVSCFVATDTEQPNALPAHTCLSALRSEKSADAVLVQYQGQWFGFVAEQFVALEEYLSRLADQRDIETKEEWRLELLKGAGSLAEFLSMPVKISAGLPTTGGLRGSGMGSAQSRAICINTLGFTRGYLSQETRTTLREVLLALIDRMDYDGIQFNTTATGNECFHSVGPNFARAALEGTDLRHPPPCPAEPLCRFAFAHYLTRWFASLKGYGRAEVEKALEGARFLLAAIPPGADALPRDAVKSFLGAFYLRCEPQYATRRWLERFIRRCERALAARWRVGVF